ncbi:MAG: bleomycin resistance protein [Acidimicrobiia bacterium]
MADRATPNLPSRDFTVTSDFYAALGFVEDFRDHGWMILSRGDLVLEFFPYPDLDPATSSFGTCLRLDDLDAFYDACLAAGVPEASHGWPRLNAPSMDRSGLRLGALVDHDCTLLRLVANP